MAICAGWVWSLGAVALGVLILPHVPTVEPGSHVVAGPISLSSTTVGWFVDVELLQVRQHARIIPITQRSRSSSHRRPSFNACRLAVACATAASAPDLQRSTSPRSASLTGSPTPRKGLPPVAARHVRLPTGTLRGIFRFRVPELEVPDSPGPVVPSIHRNSVVWASTSLSLVARAVHGSFHCFKHQGHVSFLLIYHLYRDSHAVALASCSLSPAQPIFSLHLLVILFTPPSSFSSSLPTANSAANSAHLSR
ncbi:hypothetical protein EDB80DRAFT_680653 [Ilyonectria destructans]|nr:hypothetical protein EDB80DRAFT_680653 [Ilyonectria destructans]